VRIRFRAAELRNKKNDDSAQSSSDDGKGQMSWLSDTPTSLDELPRTNPISACLFWNPRFPRLASLPVGFQ
jgi:hypothetical protein